MVPASSPKTMIWHLDSRSDQLCRVFFWMTPMWPAKGFEIEKIVSTASAPPPPARNVREP
jgi:hypothetical protein